MAASVALCEEPGEALAALRHRRGRRQPTCCGDLAVKGLRSMPKGPWSDQPSVSSAAGRGRRDCELGPSRLRRAKAGAAWPPRALMSSCDRPTSRRELLSANRAPRLQQKASARAHDRHGHTGRTAERELTIPELAAPVGGRGVERRRHRPVRLTTPFRHTPTPNYPRGGPKCVDSRMRAALSL